MKARIALAAAAALSLGTAAPVQAAGRCTRETLNVQGSPLTASYCVTASGTASVGADLPVRVSESYSGPHGSWSAERTLQFIAGETASRVIEDLPLSRVGLRGTLHLTLVLRGGAVRVDSAILTPGAITIK